MCYEVEKERVTFGGVAEMATRAEVAVCTTPPHRHQLYLPLPPRQIPHHPRL